MTQANSNGRSAERVISDILGAHGYLFTRQAPIGRGIFGTLLRADFLVRAVHGYPDGLCIESKWQEVGGSVEEKFPYLAANIRECYPCPAIVVVHGGGARKQAIDWLRRQCDTKLVAVLTLEDFLKWSNRNL
jgi:hypothetical protein